MGNSVCLPQTFIVPKYSKKQENTNTNSAKKNFLPVRAVAVHGLEGWKGRYFLFPPSCQHYCTIHLRLIGKELEKCMQKKTQ